MKTKDLTCTICRHTGSAKVHLVREMLQGTFEAFEYSECPNCGALELLDIPSNLAPYYQNNYYSHQPQGVFKSFLKAIRAAHAFGRHRIAGAILHRAFGYPPVVGWLKRINATNDWRILDVGCGEGIALRDLSLAGFKVLDGVDLFLEKDRDFGVVKLRRKSLNEAQDAYDLITLNHSIEHMENHAEVFKNLDRLLAPEGWLIVRIPIIGLAWKKFGTNWYGIDAPRHLLIHSQKSFEVLLKETPFEIAKIDFDSDEHHYLVSIQYQKDIPMTDKRSYVHGIEGSIFTPNDIEDAKKSAQLANETKDGDQATYYLRRKAKVFS